MHFSHSRIFTCLPRSRGQIRLFIFSGPYLAFPLGPNWEAAAEQYKMHRERAKLEGDVQEEAVTVEEAGGSGSGPQPQYIEH
jgi:hypothetical protein